MVTTQAERNFRKNPPPATLVDRLWFAAFFATGSAMGLFLSLALIDHGVSTLFALLAGSIAGGYGAWFVLFAILRLSALFKCKELVRDTCTDDT